MNAIMLIAALSMGFFGSLHCAGMCGPIMLILPFRFLKGWRKIAAIKLYHFGRISVYAAMGFVLHSFRHLFQPQWQRYISVGLGSLLLVVAVLSFTSGNNIQLRLPWLNFVKRQSSRFIGRPDLGALTIAGMLNGLLPCGLVYMALSLAATAPSGGSAVLVMYAFGLGTVPMLLAVTLLKGRLRFLQQASLRSAVPVIMLFFGGLFILRGMNLGIPWLSPQVVVTQHTVKSSCCHK